MLLNYETALTPSAPTPRLLYRERENSKKQQALMIRGASSRTRKIRGLGQTEPSISTSKTALRGKLLLKTAAIKKKIYIYIYIKNKTKDQYNSANWTPQTGPLQPCGTNKPTSNSQ